MRQNSGSQAQAKNEHNLNVVSIEIPSIQSTIKDFYKFAKPSEFLEANNDLLNVFLEKALQDHYSAVYLQNVVNMITFQNKFITQLHEQWSKRLSNLNVVSQ